MEFCPNCTTILNLEKEIKTDQLGGSNQSFSDIISLILNDNLNLNNLNINFNLKKILKSSEYNNLNLEEKEIIYNKIQEVLPKFDKKLFEKNLKNTSLLNLIWACKECNYKIPLKKTEFLYTETRTKFYKNNKDYTYMINNPCLPRIDNYVCINKDCKSHNGKKLAVIIKDNNNTIYICTICKNQWII